MLHTPSKPKSQKAKREKNNVEERKESEPSEYVAKLLEFQVGRKLPKLALASATLADEAKFFKQRVTVLAVGNENFRSLRDVARRGESHHAAVAVPLVLRVPLRVAGVVEV